MGIMVYNPLLWDMQDLYHQPYVRAWAILSLRVTVAAFSNKGEAETDPGPTPCQRKPTTCQWHAMFTPHATGWQWQSSCP